MFTCVHAHCCISSGVNDGAKRRLLAAAAQYLQGAGGQLESDRLSKSCSPCAALPLEALAITQLACVVASHPRLVQVASIPLTHLVRQGNYLSPTAAVLLYSMCRKSYHKALTLLYASWRWSVPTSLMIPGLCMCAGVLSPPVPNKQPKLLQTHDDSREDPYYW